MSPKFPQMLLSWNFEFGEFGGLVIHFTPLKPATFWILPMWDSENLGDYDTRHLVEIPRKRNCLLEMFLLIQYVGKSIHEVFGISVGINAGMLSIFKYLSAMKLS